jgi:hypothetical protein
MRHRSSARAVVFLDSRWDSREERIHLAWLRRLRLARGWTGIIREKVAAFFTLSTYTAIITIGDVFKTIIR